MSMLLTCTILGVASIGLVLLLAFLSLSDADRLDVSKSALRQSGPALAARLDKTSLDLAPDGVHTGASGATQEHPEQHEPDQKG